MNKILKILIKEILFYWLVSSILLLIYGYLINSLTFKICSMISILLSKVLYEDYIAKYYSGYFKIMELKK